MWFRRSLGLGEVDGARADVLRDPFAPTKHGCSLFDGRSKPGPSPAEAAQRNVRLLRSPQVPVAALGGFEIRHATILGMFRKNDEIMSVN